MPAGHHDHDHHDDHKNHAHDHDNHDNHRDHTAASGTRGDSATVDPHAWQDLENGVIYARNIARGLAEADPANAAQYQQRADQYVASMRELHAAIGQALQAIPSGRRRVVTPHDAFGYFDQAYGVTFVSAAGLSSDAEPSAKDIARLVRDIKASASTALFTEGVSGSGRVIEQVARETGLEVGGPLFSDSWQRPVNPPTPIWACSAGMPTRSSRRCSSHASNVWRRLAPTGYVVSPLSGRSPVAALSVGLRRLARG
ncbi:metal ABC transporter solute-binding protein, Zn/Mn family [Neopusillimonas aromaticivorans]|uniref:metal ABC transporter solute-binding protein, Zn/Mn family n=1 Tax=Neopusillimonas aromaticivorans TaxID=2979868 RepID=UPI00259152FA|nr:zinc ABC transporter substrate-binding protein [Neopusillimonas aromaticivorans]WJJ95042.1 zinc ABC transporter substrate-binding protein [Neopusillimonas aromaticivorans]